MAFKEHMKKQALKKTKQRYALTLSDVSLLLNSCTDLRDQVIISLMSFNGLRSDEVAHLNRNWIDFKKRTITIPLIAPEPYQPRKTYIQNKEKHLKTSEELSSWSPKTLTSAATIPILYWFTPEDDWYYHLLRKFFRSETSLGLCSRSLWNHLNRVHQRSGIKKKLYPHLLRHTYARLLRDRGYKPEDVSWLMRHSNMSTTEGYGRVEDSERCKAALLIKP